MLSFKLSGIMTVVEESAVGNKLTIFFKLLNNKNG